MQSTGRSDFCVLLFASDINVYSVARAFHEAYGIVVDAFGKADSGPCVGSRIIRYDHHPEADAPAVFLAKVQEYAAANRDRKVLILGCGDNYLDLISGNKPDYPDNVIAPYVDIDFLHALIHKEKFYALCEAHGVDYPATFIHRKGMAMNPVLPFNPPYILKPSNGVEYWKNPFPGQLKAFKADTYQEMRRILGDIYDSGYEDSVIIQDFIPGDDSYMRVLTNYSDGQGKVRMMCMGHVLLEEHTPQGIGNHAIIITEYDGDFAESIRRFLEEIGFAGFSNLDIKYDSRDGRFKVLEANPHQGRSNYFVTGSGCNIAELAVRDLIDREPLSFTAVTRENLWMVIPRRVAFSYVANLRYRESMKTLIKKGRVDNPLVYKPDMGLGRALRTFKSIMGHHAKYKKYLPKP